MGLLSHLRSVQLYVTLWPVAHQAPLSMGFSWQEYWSGLPCHSPGNLPSQGIEPASLMSPVLAGRFFTTSATWEAPFKPCAVLSHSVVSDSATPWEGHQAPLSIGILQAKILEWVAIPSSSDSSPRSPINNVTTHQSKTQNL